MVDPSHPHPHVARDAILDAHTRKLHAPPRVLVAEDDDEMRRLLVDALTREGYEVREAADGGRLLVQIAARYAFASTDGDADLLISDIRMPVCSGLQILEEIRRAQWQVPVIMMTAFGDDETRAHAESLGAVLFDKPFALDDLLTAVVNLAPPCAPSSK